MVNQTRIFTFEQVKKFIVFLLMAMLGIVVIISMIYLAWEMIDTFYFNLGKEDFQSGIFNLFGVFFLVLVGVELLETLRMYTKEHVVHVEVVLLVALIVAARKIILINYQTTPSDIFFGIAAIVVAIGVSYFLLKRAGLTRRIKEP